MATLIILFIVLVLALLILPFSKALMKDKQDLRQSPIEVRFKVLIDEINKAFLDGKGTTVYPVKNDNRWLNLHSEDRANYLFQFNYSTGHLIVYLNYKYFQKELNANVPFYNVRDVDIFIQKRMANEFIQKMPEKYHTYIEQGGTNVSGGQKQRLCIARALLKSPKILILDDSTSAVDTATDAKIKQAFAKEIPGTTKLIIAQRIASVQYADRIIVFRNGNVDGFGTHEELLATNEIYREVFESQNQGSGDFDEKEVS